MPRQMKTPSSKGPHSARRPGLEYGISFVFGLFMFWFTGRLSQLVTISYVPADELMASIIPTVLTVILFGLGAGVFAWTFSGRSRSAVRPALVAWLMVIGLSLFIIPIVDQIGLPDTDLSVQFIVFQILGAAIYAATYPLSWLMASRLSRAVK